MKNIVGYFSDLLVRWLPMSLRAKREYSYAFLVHSRDISDIYRKFPQMRALPRFLVEFFTLHSWPITVSKITGLKSQKTGKSIDGWVLGIPMTARQMMENRGLALKKIIDASVLAHKKGAKIIGLGALTSSLSKGGLDLVDRVDINVTTGHAYTAYTVTGNLFKLAELFNVDKKACRIAIVGAAGSVGSTSAKLLAREGFENLILIDVERKKRFFHELVKEIEIINKDARIEISHQIGSIRDCDFIITATNAPEALIKSDDLKPGAIVIDDAQPSDVSAEVLDREDVLAVEAGVVSTPGIQNNFNFGLKSRTDNFCCLAEVIILASQEWQEHYVLNRASLELVDEIAALGKNLSFKLADFQNFKESIPSQKLDRVKDIVSKSHGHN